MEYKQKTKNPNRNLELHVAVIASTCNDNFKKMMSETFGRRYYYYAKTYDAEINGRYDWTVYKQHTGKLGNNKVNYYIFRYDSEEIRDAHRQGLLNYYRNGEEARYFKLLRINKGAFQLQNAYRMDREEE